MADNTKSKLIQLYNLYSNNLTFHDPGLIDCFVCPICTRIFTRDSLEKGEITIEHIIPKSLGGKILTLTCKECNNISGAHLDSHLVKKLKAQDILSGKSEEGLRVKFSVGEGEATAELHLSDTDPNIGIFGIPNRSNPQKSKMIDQELEKGNATITITANLGYREISSQIAVLKSAYLLMFNYFGYGYLKYEMIQKIRNQILDSTVRTNILNGIIPLVRPPTKWNIVAVLTHPSDLKCFFVILNLSTKLDRFIGVVLPGFDAGASEIYDRWEEASRKGSSILNFNLRFIHQEEEYLSETGLKDIPLFMWQRFTTNSYE